MAKKYLHMAEEREEQQEDINWLLIPSIIIAWSAVESFVNNRCDDLNCLPEGMFELHEKALLQEKHLRFVNSGENIGNFVLEGNEYQKLENKIFFLLSKMGSRDATNVKDGLLWHNFETFKNLRDSLVHPKKNIEIELTPIIVSKQIDTAEKIIKLISSRIWNKEIKF